jgi:hypothetical protein
LLRALAIDDAEPCLLALLDTLTHAWIMCFIYSAATVGSPTPQIQGKEAPPTHPCQNDFTDGMIFLHVGGTGWYGSEAIRFDPGVEPKKPWSCHHLFIGLDASRLAAPQLYEVTRFVFHVSCLFLFT